MATKGSVIQFLLSQVRTDTGALIGGKVYFYSPGTTSTSGIEIWLDEAATSPANNPYTLDSDGTAQLYASGKYRIVIKDAAGVTQFDRDNITFFDFDNPYEYDALQYSPSTFTQASIATALTAIGTTNKVTLLLRPGNWVISTALAFPANVTVKMPAGAYFSGAAVTAGTISGIRDVRPEMFGLNTSPGTTDMTVALNAASKCLNASGGRMTLDAVKYGISDAFQLYTNIRYQGTGEASIIWPTLANQGTTLVWLGGLTGTMVRATNTQQMVWDGISLLGTYTTVNGSTLVGFDIESDTGISLYQLSNQNFFSNLSIQNCYYGIAFDRSFPGAGNTDGWVLEKFVIHGCYKGIYTNSANIAYSEIRNGYIATYSSGIDLHICGWIKITSVVGFSLSATGTSAVIDINENSGIITIENCQSEALTGSTTHSFVTFSGGTKVTPTTFIGNAIYQKIEVDAQQNTLTFIGNTFASGIYLTANNSSVVSIHDYTVSGGGFQIVGTGIKLSLSNGDGEGTWTPRLFQGATEITTPDAATGSWVRQGSLVYIIGDFSKSSGAPSAAGDFTMQGLPYGPSYLAAEGGLLGAGSITINGVEYDTVTPYRWTIGVGLLTAVLVGAQKALSWTSGTIHMQIVGVYNIFQFTP